MTRYLVRERGSDKALTVWGWYDQAVQSAVSRTFRLDIAHEIINERTGRVLLSFSRDDLVRLRRRAEQQNTAPKP